MPEIGQTLREARIRQRLDIAVVEEQTKIRAKYLRALENEEWGLLPGATYVKTFLRGYAEFLGLDAQPLVDEYVERYSGAQEHELFRQYAEPPLRERLPYRPPRTPPPGALILGVIAVLLGFLLILGLTSGNDKNGGEQASTPAITTIVPTARTRTTAPAKAKPQLATASLRATGPVWVCLVNDAGKGLVNAQVLQAGDKRGPFRSRHLQVTFGTGNVSLRANGRAVDVPAALRNGVGYDITPTKVSKLTPDKRPSCGPSTTTTTSGQTG